MMREHKFDVVQSEEPLHGRERGGQLTEDLQCGLQNYLVITPVAKVEENLAHEQLQNCRLVRDSNKLGKRLVHLKCAKKERRLVKFKVDKRREPKFP